MNTSSELPFTTTETGNFAPRKNWRRWEMASLEPRTPPPAARPSGPSQDSGAQALRERARMLAEARQQAWSSGHAEGLEQGRKKGYDEGHAQGLEAGRRAGHAAGEADGRAQGLRQGQAQGRQDAHEQALRLRDLASGFSQALDALDDEVSQALIALAVRIADQVVRRHLRDHPDAVLDLVDEVLRAASDTHTCLRLRVHPEDARLLAQHLDHDTDASSLRVIADEGVTRGGCMLESAQGEIDATLETRWRRVVEALDHPAGAV